MTLPSSYLRLRAGVLAAVGLASLLSISLLGCGGGTTTATSIAPSPKTLSSISIAPANPSVALGTTAQFTATGIYSDGSKQDLTTSVTWKTAQPTVAIINDSGMAVTKGTGSTAVIASSGSINSSQTLTVSSATLVSVAVGPQGLSIKPGFSVQLTATGTYSDGTHQDLTASAAWSSSLQTVAWVSPKGVATAMAGGMTTITASSGSLSGSDALSVASLTVISVTPTSPTIPLGENQQLSALGTFSDGSAQDVSNSVTWSSSATGTALVSGTGLVSGLTQGSATVTAQSGTVAGSDLVTVGPPALVSLTVLPTTGTIALGGTLGFKASGKLSDGSTQDVTSSSTWSSADPSIAAIDNTGLAFGAQIGNTTITATSGSASGSAALTVDPLLAVTYFDNANVAGLAADANIRFSNPGMTGGSLCAMVYVFAADQQLSECCGCIVTPDGLRTLSVNTDLTSNPLTGVTLNNGMIEVVPADLVSNPTCNPAAITPKGLVSTWATHIQNFPGNNFVETEDSFQRTPLTDAALSTLQSDCTFLGILGSGHGVCTCGGGD